MAKYSYEFKKKIVMEYLNGGGGTGYLTKKYGVASSTDIKKWIKNYNVFVMMGYGDLENKKNILLKRS